MKILLGLVPACMLAFGTFGQDTDNLVENGSFESASSKLRRLGMIEMADGWTSPTGNSADLFAANAKMPDVATPENVYGKEVPKDGNNYAGIVVYSYNDKMNRTYITTRLTQPMKKGMRYQVMFHASLAELSKYSSNKLGAHFSKKPFNVKDKIPALIDETHVMHPDETIFNGMYGWDVVCGEYVSTGNEKYITIGNFTPNNDVGQERMKKPKEVKGTQIIAAYYYIDDVSVRLLGPDEQCDCPYGDNQKQVSMVVFQRTPAVNDKMTPAEILEQYNVYYATGRYDITVSGEDAINKVAELMSQNPSMKLRVTGHLDNDEYDEAEFRGTSKKRAEYVRTKLVEKGVAENRIIVDDVQNRKRSKHITENDDEQVSNAKNRRVSFSIVQ